jgi:hypothetical protein
MLGLKFELCFFERGDRMMWARNSVKSAFQGFFTAGTGRQGRSGRQNRLRIGLDPWRDAGILAGLLARLQSYGKNEQRKALNDALIFLTAAKGGSVVLTRNVSEFDLLMQLDARGQAIFYDSV